MRELIPKMECFVSSDFVKIEISDASTIGDEPKFVTQIVVAPPIFESRRASTISLDDHE